MERSDPIVLADELRARGFDKAAINQLRRDGELRAVRRGAYRLGKDLAATVGAEDAHRERLAAVVRQYSADAVVSHMSAALLHSLPTWREELDRVQLIRDRPGGGRRRSDVIVRGLPLGPQDVVEMDGMQVTSVARTVLDLACQLPLRRSVAVGDAAVRQASLSYPFLDLVPELAASAAAAAGRTGVPRARQAIAMLDGRSETVGESVSRVVILQAGLPAPVLQYEVRDDSGELLGRSDFAWPDRRTLGEFDGRIKYSGQYGETADLLYAEKRREDRMRAAGWEMVRWVWDDLRAPGAPRAQHRPGLRASRPPPLTHSHPWARSALTQEGCEPW